jgi:hypothetical protein
MSTFGWKKAQDNVANICFFLRKMDPRYSVTNMNMPMKGTPHGTQGSNVLKHQRTMGQPIIGQSKDKGYREIPLGKSQGYGTSHREARLLDSIPMRNH